ncbi:energy transducer TonB, partial [Treponema sp. OttesenSCG-928-L16]|nr:energy transducer TonB [Treponema sp. OttesenSCG-928-L16]
MKNGDVRQEWKYEDIKRFMSAIFLALSLNTAVFFLGNAVLRSSSTMNSGASGPSPVLIYLASGGQTEASAASQMPGMYASEFPELPQESSAGISEKAPADAGASHSYSKPGIEPREAEARIGGTETDRPGISGIGSGGGADPETGTDHGFSRPAYSSAGGNREQLLARIDSLIRSRLSYPPLARRRNIEGSVGLTLLIGTAGELSGALVSSTAGSSILDQAALSLAKELFPLSNVSLPEPLELSVSIRY